MSTADQFSSFITQQLSDEPTPEPEVVPEPEPPRGPRPDRSQGATSGARKGNPGELFEQFMTANLRGLPFKR